MQLSPFLSRTTLFAVVTLALGAPAVRAQSLAQRVRDARDGTVELRYAARAGVCGDGSHSWSIGRSSHTDDGIVVNGMRSMQPCLPGPVRVRLQTERGVVRIARLDVGPAPARPNDRVTDLGTVSASAAADYLLDLATADGTGAPARAITAAALADSASVWRRLLRIARDSTTSARSTRREAAFWLALFTAAKLDGRGESLALDDDDDEERDDPKSSAIFALSQLRNHEGIDPLLQIARTNRDAALRRKALFWLGQSGDPRALALFGEILSRS
ncbi:MAG: lyase domain protein repeat-containing protein [Gemmatimonadetes bacterium]|nr:lyase domain protein repeat-containing protein [Gemmatimonadota bacterium]